MHVLCCLCQQVREAAREAVLSMDLSAEEAFDIAKKAFYGGLVELGEGAGSNEQGQIANFMTLIVYAISLSLAMWWLCQDGMRVLSFYWTGDEIVLLCMKFL